MYPDVEQYLRSLPNSRQLRIQDLHALILELYPDVQVDMSDKMPTYRVGEGWVALANRKHYISVYTCGAHHIEAFKQHHPDLKTGKGCINFRDQDDIPWADLRQVIQHAIEHPKP
mgnify:CR=1 FL=1